MSIDFAKLAEMQHTLEGWERNVLPRPPLVWEKVSDSADGAAWRSPKYGLRVIATAARELDGKRWLHVSVSHGSRAVNWEDIGRVKSHFIGNGRTAIQVLPPTENYVNIHPNCFHLWHCLDGDVTPDFTRGSGSI